MIKYKQIILNSVVYRYSCDYFKKRDEMHLHRYKTIIKKKYNIYVWISSSDDASLEKILIKSVHVL